MPQDLLSIFIKVMDLMNHSVRQKKENMLKMNHSLNHYILCLVFIYTCPSNSKIRERMLYSSSKANVINAAENEVSLKVIKKVSV